MGTVNDGVDTTPASWSETVQDSTDDLQHRMGIAEQGENNSLISAGYSDAQAPSLAYMRQYHEYPGMSAHYRYPIYPSSWMYPSMSHPPPLTSASQKENGSHWRGASSSSGSSSKLWQPYANDGATKAKPTSRKRRAEERAPSHKDPSPVSGVHRTQPTVARGRANASRSKPNSEHAPTVWLNTTILSSACKVCEPYDDHVIHLMSSQIVHIGAWRTRSVKTDIHFCFRSCIYGEIRPSHRTMQCHASLVVEVQRLPAIPPDGVMVTVHNASDGILILHPRDEIAELVVLQALIPKFVIHHAKNDKSTWTTPGQPVPRDVEDSTDA